MALPKVRIGEMKTYVHQKACAPMFTASELVIPQARDNPDVLQ